MKGRWQADEEKEQLNEKLQRDDPREDAQLDEEDKINWRNGEKSI